LPDGASVNRTNRGCQAVENLIKDHAAGADTISNRGLLVLDSYSASNNAFLVAKMRPFEDRTKFVWRSTGDPRGDRFSLQSAACDRPITAEVLIFQLENLEGAILPQWQAGKGRWPQPQKTTLAAGFSTYTANAPSLNLDIDREKAQALGLNVSDVFTTLQRR